MSKIVLSFLVCSLFFLQGCAGRSAVETLKGSRKRYPSKSLWDVFGAAQNVLQQDGFIVNLSQQNKGILIGSIQKTAKPNKAFDRIAEVTGASFREGDFIQVLVSMQTVKQQAEIRVSVLRERENEWMQEDGDEIGNDIFYRDFFGRVDRRVGSGSDSKPPSKKPAG